MIGLRVEAEAARLLARGAVGVVLAPGATLPPLPPLLALEWREGTLLRPGIEPGRLAPLPAEARLLALVAPDRAAAARIAPLLPGGVVPVTGGDPLPALLRLMASAMQAAWDARGEAEAARDAAVRALGHRPAAAGRLLLDLPPDAEAGRVAPNVSQPLGRAAEGLCAIAVHLDDAACGPGSMLRLRVVVGDRIRGAWAVPGEALEPGWLTLDLPEPLRAGAAEAMIEVAAGLAEGDRLTLSATSPGTAPLALRAWTAPPGRYVMPRHADWAALDTPAAGLPLALPAEALRAAEVEGATAHLVAVGGEEERLLVSLSAAEASLVLPPLVAGPAELLRLDLACRQGTTAEAALWLASPSGSVASGWRRFDVGGALTLTIPLPAGPATPRLRLRGESALIEVSRLALLSGLRGDLPAPPAAEAPRAAPRPGATFVAALPGSSHRVAPPQPPLVLAEPGAPPTTATAAPVMEAAAGGAVSFQDVTVQQHLVSPDGGYRHLDMVVSGLVAPVGLWRQVRTKLFDRRGTVGLEFREAQGWPRMFDVWPAGKTDNFGPFWRLETGEAATNLTALATPHDRALVAALLEVLPDLAGRAGAAAGLDRAETDAWAGRARRLSDAVAEARARIS